MLNQRNGTNDDNVQRNVTATANSLFAFDGSLIPTATAAPILASVQANASGGLLLKNFSGTTVMTVGPGSGTGVAFNASGLTSVNSVTAAASTDLTLTAGSGNQGVAVAGTGSGATATAVNTGGFKSANFGLSTVSAGASYFGGDVIATGSATTVFRSTATNNNAIAGVAITTGNGGSLQTWLVVGNASGASGEFVIRDSTAGASALTITKGTLAATFGGAVTIAGTVIHTLSATPASASAAGTVGTMSWDANYIYICTSTNTWKRVAIATW